eukprot:PITA_00859
MGRFGCSMLVGIGMEILILLRVGMAPHGVEAWGNEGHYSICKIAEPLLSEEASIAVKKLLPEDAEGDLASLCSWADHMRFHYPWSSPLHFIDTQDNKCSYVYSRDCHNAEGEIGMCLEGAIKNYTSQLETYGSRADSEKYNLTEALLFLSHFIGDVHQPLHVGFSTDEGGNTIILHWYRQKSNLHHVSKYIGPLIDILLCLRCCDCQQIWDTLMIETAMKDFYDDDLEVMISSIQRNITDSWSDEVPTWEKCNGHDLACPKVYADESIILACKWAYKDAEANSVLEDDYFLSRLPIVQTQLAKAGVRLAATLNRLFNSKKGYNRKSEL